MALHKGRAIDAVLTFWYKNRGVSEGALAMASCAAMFGRADKEKAVVIHNGIEVEKFSDYNDKTNYKIKMTD